MSDLRERRINILNLVASGELTLEQGNRLLAQLEDGAASRAPVLTPTAWPAATLATASEDPDPPAAPVLQQDDVQLTTPAAGMVDNDPPPASDPSPAAAPSSPSVQPDEVVQETRSSGGSRGMWLLPFLVGLFLTLVSANWMYLGYAAAGLGWGFWLSFLPLALGIILMWAGWEMRQARWLHLRIRQSPGHTPATVAISIPLPIGLTRWAVQHFGKFSPTVNGQNAGDILDELDEALAADGPMHIYVDGDRGEQVELWIDGPRQKP
jgi:hypothetical protein